jgi:hypothetical protein
MIRKPGDRPKVCYCRPGICSAPKPEWCIGVRACQQPGCDEPATRSLEDGGKITIWCKAHDPAQMHPPGCECPECWQAMEAGGQSDGL